nr:uncharacterized protein LOC120962470 isoform X2 [Aegilops tauschii subsp. strangulata]
MLEFHLAGAQDPSAAAQAASTPGLSRARAPPCVSASSSSWPKQPNRRPSAQAQQPCASSLDQPELLPASRTRAPELLWSRTSFVTPNGHFVSLVAVTCPLLPSFSCSSSPLSLIPLVSSLTRRTSCRQHRRRWTPDAQIRSPSLPRRRPCRRRLHRFLTRTAPLQFVSSASLCPIWSPLTVSIGWVTTAQAQLPSPASPAPRVPAGPIFGFVPEL